MRGLQRANRFLHLYEGLHTNGLGKITVYRRIREGRFPKQVRIGPNSVAWRQSAISQWIATAPLATTNQYIDQYTKH
ncbi:AlpA family phage regulatory protein [Pseudomonas sp. CCM 7891]|uniref:AlpA family phage regulatory protein n=1 Tax=Pseudomonas karstica TaxID=1055468 RepID=A0A7X2RQ67_9PSED|nr:AlpA family phage regulatory protein [Pseudomonas karstica]